MRIGTVLNTFKLVPRILEDTLVLNPATRLHGMDRVMFYIADKCFNKLADGSGKAIFTLENQIKELRAVGAEHFELTGDLIFMKPDMAEWWQAQFPYLRKLKGEGVTFSVHLPQFCALEIDSYLPEISIASVQAIKRMIAFFEPIDPTNYVLHLGGERFHSYMNLHLNDPIIDQELNKMFPGAWLDKIKKKSTKKFLHWLTAWVRRYTDRAISIPQVLSALRELEKVVPLKKICLENLENHDFEMMADQVLKETEVSICFDVGHSVIQAGVKNTARFIKKYHNRLTQLHLHDVTTIAKTTYNNGQTIDVLQDHKPLGTGMVDVKKDVLEPLQKYNFTGQIVIEDYYHDPVPSVILLKKLIDGLK